MFVVFVDLAVWRGTRVRLMRGREEEEGRKHGPDIDLLCLLAYKVTWNSIMSIKAGKSHSARSNLHFSLSLPISSF